MNEYLELKVVLLGDPGVGKTSIISRYINDKFNNDVESSVAMNFSTKNTERNKIKIRLNIWDTIGQEKLRSISNIFLNNTKIAILVYSIISESSFKSLDYWLQKFKDKISDDAILGVAGNKQDLFLEQVVDDDKGREFAKKNNAIFSLISAKKDKNGLDIFMDKLVDAYLDKNNSNKPEIKKYLKLNKNNLEKEGGSCCGGKKKNENKYNNLIQTKNGVLYSLFLGEKNVGKTSLIKRIKGKSFNDKETHTENFDENLIISEETKIQLYIYDANIDKVKSKEFIALVKKINIFFLIYDVKNLKTLDALKYWIGIIEKCKGSDKNYIFYVVGNKDDEITDDKKITNEEMQKFCLKYKAKFRTSSAKNDRGLENIIGEAIKNYLDITS